MFVLLLLSLWLLWLSGFGSGLAFSITNCGNKKVRTTVMELSGFLGRLKNYFSKRLGGSWWRSGGGYAWSHFLNPVRVSGGCGRLNRPSLAVDLNVLNYFGAFSAVSGYRGSN